MLTWWHAREHSDLAPLSFSHFNLDFFSPSHCFEYLKCFLFPLCSERAPARFKSGTLRGSVLGNSRGARSFTCWPRGTLYHCQGNLTHVCQPPGRPLSVKFDFQGCHSKWASTALWACVAPQQDRPFLSHSASETCVVSGCFVSVSEGFGSMLSDGNKAALGSGEAWRHKWLWPLWG